jgi:hypothetical protein
MFQRVQAKLKESSVTLDKLTKEIDKDDASLRQLNEQKQQLIVQQQQFLDGIKYKEAEAQINLLDATVRQLLAIEVRADRAGAYVPSPELDNLYAQINKLEKENIRRKANLENHQIKIDEYNSDKLAALLQVTERRKQQLFNDISALSTKIQMNQRLALELASQIAVCIDEVSAPAHRIRK